MSVVKTLNEQKKLGYGVAAALLILGLGFLAYQAMGRRQTVDAAPRGNAFFTDDDGKTFFKDDIEKFVPFTHNGKQAYRCDVFAGSDGKQFVGLIYRHTDAGRKEIQSYFASKPKDPDGTAHMLMEKGRMQVKPAGANDKAWAANDEVTVERLQSSVTDSAGKPAKLVVPQ
jgi:hypothetical protein